MPLLHQRNSIFEPCPQRNWYKPPPTNIEAIYLMQSPKNTKQVCGFLGLVGYYQKFIKKFAWITKPLTTLTCHNSKFDWMPDHEAAFISLKGALIQAPILHYPDPLKWYIAHIDASDNTCGAQLSQIHSGQELPVVFLSHTFTNAAKMEHYRTRGLWCLLCLNKMELLFSRDLASSCTMNTNLCRSFSMARM